MKLLSISGGSTKIPGLAGAADHLINKMEYQPDLIVGTSAGAILALPIALGYWKDIKEKTVNFKLCDIFSVPPMKNGKITWRAKLRILMGEISLGKQDNLVKTISKIISEYDFTKYINSSHLPDVYVGAIDYKTGDRIYKNIRECTYEEYLQYVLASSSIPYAVEPVEIDNRILFDGGARDHIGSHWMIKHIEGITENVSIFSRPQEFKNILNKNWNPENIFDIFERDQAIRVLEISKKDEELEKLWAEKKSINHQAIFLPSIMNELYEVNREKAETLYYEGKKATVKWFKP